MKTLSQPEMRHEFIVNDQPLRPVIADSAPRQDWSTRSTPHIPTLRAVHALLLIALAL
jgi:hypothetical protein